MYSSLHHHGDRNSIKTPQPNLGSDPLRLFSSGFIKFNFNLFELFPPRATAARRKLVIEFEMCAFLVPDHTYYSMDSHRLDRQLLSYQCEQKIDKYGESSSIM